MSAPDLFGRFFKEKRKELGLTLRKFCLETGLDPGNVSKMERGLLPPPSSRDKLEEYAAKLNIQQDSEDWFKFLDLAAATAGRIPVDVMSDEELVSKLPLIFRTLRGQRPTEKQLRDLAETLRRS